MNPFSLNMENFSSEITKSDLARTNLFRVQINPAIIAKVIADKNNKLYSSVKKGIDNGFTSPFTSVQSSIDFIGQLGTAVGTINQISSLNKIDKGLMCKAVNIPGTSIETEISYSSKPFRTLPKYNTFAPVTLTFYAETDQSNRRFFEDWQNMVVDRQTGLVGYYNEYTTGVFVYTYDRNGKATALTYFHECYPTQVGAIQLNWDSNNEIMTYDVELTYLWSVTSDANPASIIELISKEIL